MSYICAKCIGEPVLSDLTSANASSDNVCDYCERALPALDIWYIAKKCDEVIETFYEVSSRAMAVVVYGRTPAGDDLRSTVGKLVQVPDDALDEIVDTLQLMWYDQDSDEHKYGDEDPWFILRKQMQSPLSKEWKVMESSLHGEARYLNPNVARFMETVFGDVADDVTANGTPVIVSAGSGSAYDTLYRARVFQSEEGLTKALQHPERFLGAASVGIGSSGRMNAVGLPAFYGATNAQTALAEVRPPVGSWVVVASFAMIRPLKLLDLTLLGEVQLKETASLFDAATKDAAERRDFLQVLCKKMTMPVMPENQDRSYLITQVIADYLAMHPKVSIDGIIYPSVQRSESDRGSANANVVLFHKAATTVDADLERATAHVELWEYDEDGPDKYFHPKIAFLPERIRPNFISPGYHPQPGLALVRESIQIHCIRYVEISSVATDLEVVHDQRIKNWN